MLFNLLAEGDPVIPTVDWAAVWDVVVNWLTSTGIKLVIAIVLLIITFKIINVVTKRLYKRLQKKHADETIARVGTTSLKWFLKIIILVCLVGYVGIETASISAVIASLGVGISLAVQGTLSNFTGGVIIIVMRPFKIGDYVISNGVEGTVEDIKLFYTHLATPDNKMVVIPNGTLANNVIVNTSEKETRRLDLVFNISYVNDTEKVKALLTAVCAEYDLVFKDPAPFVTVSQLGDKAASVLVRIWCKNSDYWTVNFYLNDKIKKVFDENGIVVPYNKLELTVNNSSENNGENT